MQSELFKTVKYMLLGIWATEKNDCDQSKCSLRYSILKIDKQLERGQITLEPKKGKHRERNFKVTKAPDIFREYVGIDNLTVEQLEVFNSREKLSWINGPAGAGKTVILSGNLLQLVLSGQQGDRKVVIFQFAAIGGNSLFERVLKKAEIQYDEVVSRYDFRQYPSILELRDFISGSQHKVVIVKITDGLLNIQNFTEILESARDCHLFVDDLQRVLQFSTHEMFSSLVDKLVEFSSTGRIWIGCDFVQAYHMLDNQRRINMEAARLISEKLDQWKTLSVNLRNTFELSKILSVIRAQFIKSFVKGPDILNTDKYNRAVDTIVPEQISGHFIHGPKIEIHFLSKYDATLMCHVVKKEQEKLGPEMCLLYDPALNELVQEINHDVNRKIMLEFSSSQEWPTVIVLHLIWKHDQWDLPRLYLAISRARVYCSVVMIPSEDTTEEDLKHIQDLMLKLKESVHIICH